MILSKDKFEQNLINERQQPYFEGFSRQYGQDVLAQDRLAARLAALPAEFDVRDILPPLDLEARDFSEWPKQILWVAKLAAASAVDSFVPAEVRIEGDYLPENEDGDYTSLTIIAGNLTVTGNLITKANLVVLGHAHVHGAWVDTFMDIAVSVVAGNLTVDKSLLTEGGLGVGGRLTAPFISLNYNQGYTTVLGGCTARFLTERDHGGSWIYGASDIRYLVCDELRLEPMLAHYENSGEELRNHLDELFQPAFVAAFNPRHHALQQAFARRNEPGSTYYKQQSAFDDDFAEALYQGFTLEDPHVFRFG
jgi:hypothetical protein